MTEPAWGRVAEDGTVFVRTSDGERAVGSFQAGSADEALAYYSRKYDALDLEVELFERRARLPEVSADEATAQLVGQRHGKPAVLVIDAAAMTAAGSAFFLSANGVWLVEHVPAAFITFPAAES